RAPARRRRRQHPGRLQRQRARVRREPAGGGVMNDYAPWLEANDRYLAGALADLRARLERAAQRTDQPAPVPASAATALMEAAPTVSVSAAPRHSWFARMFGDAHERLPSTTARTSEPSASRPIVAAIPEGGTAPAETGAVAGAAGDEAHAPALAILANRLGLSAFERDVLLLCIGMELDTRFPTLCA